MDYYASLGYTPMVLIDAKDLVGQLRSVIVFHGDMNKQQVTAVKEARRLLDQIGAVGKFVEVENPWDFTACYTAICRIHRERGAPTTVVVNASGGTEVFNSALTVFALVAGFPARYVNRRSWKAVTVDFAAVRDALGLDGSKRGILQEVLAAGGRRSSQGLPETLGLTRSAVHQHVAALVQRGVLKAERTGRTVMLEATPSLWALQQFHGEAVRPS